MLLAAGAASAAALAVVPRAALASTAAPAIEVFKSPLCGCCEGWVSHLRQNGFAATVRNVEDTGEHRARLGMPERFGSCHTGVVEGYVLEGHVPAADIRKLLAARPKATGLAVPGMPVGSPGMEQGDRRDTYDVLLVRADGTASRFTHYPGNR
ncbi:DUF411 domain-containing protein [Cupriavidus sp. AU9028]|uniref:DUF411 domain-containing protein n=1 Tax=Cupriavidus sp. AU9028 TaxID=2871157 RepID=UPI001C968572|nr:DUF411 domain-containing protein [Cupriavidus sp. AU9028]MBY4898832.1 DUF411 domain-containing protein [Cupriavidus sp. AU9028]